VPLVRLKAIFQITLAAKNRFRLFVRLTADGYFDWATGKTVVVLC